MGEREAPISGCSVGVMESCFVEDFLPSTEGHSFLLHLKSPDIPLGGSGPPR